MGRERATMGRGENGYGECRLSNGYSMGHGEARRTCIEEFLKRMNMSNCVDLRSSPCSSRYRKARGSDLDGFLSHPIPSYLIPSESLREAPARLSICSTGQAHL
jgi:hypothetical protein